MNFAGDEMLHNERYMNLLEENDRLTKKLKKIDEEVDGLIQMLKDEKTWNPRVMKIKQILKENNDVLVD